MSERKEKWNTRYRKKDPQTSFEPSSYLKEIIAGREPGRALDLAAGDGRNSVYLAEHGWQVTAVDFAEEGIVRGRNRAVKNRVSVDWKMADLTSYLPQKGHYDLVCIFYLHLPHGELKPILTRASSALKLGGILLIVGHDAKNITEGVGGPQDPDLLYSPADISTALALAGLEVEYTASDRVPPDHESYSEGAVQIDCVVRARRRGNGD